MKPIYLWTIAITAVIVASFLSVAAYASLHGGLDLVAMTYGAMALLVVTILIVQSFIVPREKAFTQPWLVSYLLSAPVALVFVVMIFYRAVGCILYDPAYLFSTMLAFCIFTLLSPLFIFPAPLKLRLPAAVIVIVVLLVPGSRLSDPFGPRHEVFRPSNFMGYFLAGPKSDARVIVRTMRESGATPGRYDHVWHSHGDDGVLTRNFGPTDYDPVVVLLDEDELLGHFVLEENGGRFIRFNSRLENIDPAPSEVSGEGFVKSWQLTNVQRDIEADIKNGVEGKGFHDLVARNVQDGKAVVFEGFSYHQIATWQDENTLLAVRRFITEHSELVNVPSENPDEFGEWISTPGKSIIQLVALNLIDAEITLVRSVELDDIPSIVAPLDDVGLMMTGSNHDDMPLLYLDWESGEVSTLLSGIDTGSLAVLTVDDTIRFACQQTLTDETKRVAMGTHEGVSATLPIDEGKSAMFAYPSPDGEKAFIAIKESPWGYEFVDDFVVYAVWDSRSGEVTRLAGHGPMAAYYNPEIRSRSYWLKLEGTIDSPWSSDSRKLVFIYSESTGYDLADRLRLHIVHLGR